MIEAKEIRRLGHGLVNIGLIYLVIALIVGIWIFYQDINDEIVEVYIASAFTRFLYMSIIITIIGAMINLWSIGTDRGIYRVTNGQLRSAQISGVLLTLGAILTLVLGSMEVEKGALFGYVLFFIGVLMVALGYTMAGGGKE